METQNGETVERYSLRIRGWYGRARAVVGFLVRLLARFDVRGLEHVPSQGPYLLITNHLHWLDPPMLMAAFPYRAWVFAAEKWEKHRFLGPLFRSLGAIFVRRGEVDRKALRKALAVLQGGGVLGLAPEGTRSKTGALQRGRSGAAYMAFRARALVVPVVITGQEKVFPALRRLRRAHVRAIFGPPFSPPALPEGGKARAGEVHAFAEEMMYRMAAMLPPEYRGVYADVAEVRPHLLARCGVAHETSTF